MCSLLSTPFVVWGHTGSHPSTNKSGTAPHVLLKVDNSSKRSVIIAGGNAALHTYARVMLASGPRLSAQFVDVRCWDELSLMGLVI
jgi:hypothetical protein